VNLRIVLISENLRIVLICVNLRVFWSA